MKIKKSIRSIISIFLIVATLLSMLSITASAETYPENPDGGTYTETNHKGSEKQTIVYIRRQSDNKLLKKFVINGPAGDYFVEGLVMWGYDTVEEDFPWHLMVDCKLCYASSNTFQNGRASYFQIGSEFTKILSPAKYEATVYCDPHTPTVTVKHIKVDQNGSESLHSSSTAYLTFDSYFSQSKKTISNYTLSPGYSSSVSGNFRWTMLDETPNMPEDSYSARFWSVTFDGADRCYYDDWKFDIEFKYTLNHWDVKYNANGGSGAPATQTKWYGVPLTLSTQTPTRTGYTFLGWSTSSSATYASYSPGQSYTSNSGKTFYAVWSKNSYTIQYNANGGSGAPASQTKKYGETLTLSSVKPTRSGYTFKGWSTSSTATTPTYYAGGSYTANSGATLYAVWEKNATPTPVTYTVSYNANGGSGAPASQTKTQNVTLTLSSTKPTRSGYTFLGWSTSSTATYPLYYAGGSYTANASATLYAVWEKNVTPAPTTYTVSYNANGGSGAPSSQTKTYGVNLTLSSVKPTRSGYSFLGWSTSSTASSATYLAGGTYTANASANLYAVWSKNAPATYTVSYNANGGTGAPASQTKTNGVTLYLSSTEPTRNNYRFLGWSTSSTATSPSYYAGSSFNVNANTTLYAVWEYVPNSYTISYNANGGSGAPSSQTKTEDVAITLSSSRPSRSGHDFLGWSTSSSATSATYDPGDTYTANASVTLYAVWQETNYDFSISNLTVSDTVPYKYDQITVKVRTDSWDKINPYSDIPVQLYYDGRLVGTQYVDFAAYGVANVTFTLNLGSAIGNKTIEARINWADHYSESRTGNNTVSTTINVQDFDYEVTMDPVSSAGYYCEGMEVISSFFVANNSEYDIIPSHRNTARFTAYYYSGTSKVVIATDDWDNVVIPAGGTNLVYFKWRVPTGLEGKTIYFECVINADRYMNETNYNNNTASFSTTISSVTDSQTPNTRYESQAPSSYQSTSAPAVSTDKATWTMWVYENNGFVLKKYGIQISSTSPIVAPSSECKTAEYINGKWTMGAGYGVTLSYSPGITTVSGCLSPDSDAYTSVQYVVATFPEYRYYDTDGSCRTLEYINGTYQFVENSDADEDARVHFIPVYVNDGNYIISVTATHVWTPAGMIEATRNANIIVIDGTIYDDWYQS